MKRVIILIGVGIGLGIVSVYFLFFLAAQPRSPEELLQPIEAQEIPDRSQSQGIIEDALIGNTQDANRSGNIDGDEVRREKIQHYKKIGYDYFRKQRDYLESIKDPDARRQLDLLVTGSNQLMFAAVVQEMALNPEYKDQLASLLNNDGAFRVFVIDTMDQFMPRLVTHLKSGREVKSPDIEKLFAERQDFLIQLDKRYLSELPPELANDLETGVSHALAADILQWNEIRRGKLTSEGPPFVWGSRYDAIN